MGKWFQQFFWSGSVPTVQLNFLSESVTLFCCHVNHLAVLIFFWRIWQLSWRKKLIVFKVVLLFVLVLLHFILLCFYALPMVYFCSLCSRVFLHCFPALSCAVSLSGYMLYPCLWNTFSMPGHKRCILLCEVLLFCIEICFLSRTVNILCFIFIVCNISACDLCMLQITDSVNYRLIGFVPSLAKCELFAHENILYFLNGF